MEVTRTFTVRTAPHDVAAYLRDFGHSEEWDPGTVFCTRLDDGPVAVGSRWLTVSRVPGRQTELTYELTRDEPGALRFVGRNDSATATEEITLTAGADPGTTEITYLARVDFHGVASLATLFARFAFKRLADETEESLVRVLGKP